MHIFGRLYGCVDFNCTTKKNTINVITSSVASALRFTTNTLGSIGLSATAGGFKPCACVYV